jgi:hypothetical protein
LRRRAPGGALRTANREMAGMRKLASGIALLALLALLVPGIASAQLREFKGKVDKISKSEMIIDNRMGDKLKFKPAKDVVVEGEKDSLKKVKKGDWVIVSWKMMDDPRIAYKIVVIPEVKEAGEEAE